MLQTEFQKVAPHGGQEPGFQPGRHQGGSAPLNPRMHTSNCRSRTFVIDVGHFVLVPATSGIQMQRMGVKVARQVARRDRSIRLLVQVNRCAWRCLDGRPLGTSRA